MQGLCPSQASVSLTCYVMGGLPRLEDPWDTLSTRPLDSSEGDKTSASRTEVLLGAREAAQRDGGSRWWLPGEAGSRLVSG